MKKIAVIISCFSWYENRLCYIDEYLQKRGYETFILQSDFKHTMKKYDLHLESVKNLKYIHVPSYKSNISIKRLYSHKCFANSVVKYIDNIQPDLVYAIVPPNSLVKGIASVKEKRKFKLIFDVIDLWPESFPLPKANIPPFSNWRNMRDHYLNYADLVVLECSYYEEILKNSVDNEKFRKLYLFKKPYISENCSETRMFNGVVRLAYLGAINDLIDIDKICNIVSKIQEFYPVEVRIIGKGKRKDIFIERLKEIGAKVIYYGVIYDDCEKTKILGVCHFGLNVYKSNIKVGLTIKSIDYMQMGLPLINSISGDTYSLIEETSIGVNIMNNKEEYLDEIMALLNNLDETKVKVENIFNERFSTDNIENNLSFLNAII